MTGVYAQSEIEWTQTFRTMIGLRGDLYRYSVRSDNVANSGDGDAGMISPKVGAVFGPWSGTELYANAGRGFHSNDARGAVTRVDPKTGDAVDPVTPLVRARR
jgi:outer membrane receptor protein involved in Fe transport